MTDAERAYAEAERLIEAARVGGDHALSLNTNDTHALAVLPPGIAGLPALRHLDLANTKITDLAPLAGLSALWHLDLANTKITDLAPLAGLSALTELLLNDTQVTDLAPLAGLSGLTELWLNRTQVTDLAPLAGLSALTSLWLNGTQVTDLAPLAGLSALTDLWLNDTQVTDLAPLSGLSALTRLWLNDTQVTDLAPLAGLTGLDTLILNDIPAIDFRPISKAINLTLLDTASKDKILGLFSRGLHFKRTGATKIDPWIAEIADIEDDAERAGTLFDYLEDWVPPGEATPRPDSAPLPEKFVFLSYSSGDRANVALYRDIFRGLGLPVWWDQDIFSGSDWRQTIAKQLDAASGVLTFWTAKSVVSKPVIEEAARAQSAGKLVHVRLDDAPLPYGFGETQYSDLRNWDGNVAHPEMQKLLQALRDKLDPPDQAMMTARLTAASPVAMLPQGGKLLPVDTPPHVRPEIENAPDLEARLEGIRQWLGPLQAKVADRDHYQFPADLNHALYAIAAAVNATKLTWYAIRNARATLCDVLIEHDAKNAWNKVTFLELTRLTRDMEEMRILLQPRQVPAGEPGAKPPDTDPHIRNDDVTPVQNLVGEILDVVDGATDTLDPAAIALVRTEVDQIRSATGLMDETRKFDRLRNGTRGLAYLTGSIIVGVSTGIGANLLTSTEAAVTLSQKLQPLYERLIQLFL